MGSSEADEDQLLKSFLAEVGEAERDNEVLRILGCFKLNPFEHLKLSFDSSPDEVKKQYRKQLLLDPQERGYILDQVTAAKEELRAKRKKELKKDSASKIKSLVDEVSSWRDFMKTGKKIAFPVGMCPGAARQSGRAAAQVLDDQSLLVPLGYHKNDSKWSLIGLDYNTDGRPKISTATGNVKPDARWPAGGGGGAMQMK
ncbi:hypothetical protein BAE44_0021203 [Dichanthelium oligosanthes]|uniref:J domain-containing protein n=1 Tax=Dichanthelium oligosanthes TaxID=888268 RepID=A0A1E5UY32_9POAL|nr:hypothetical protein BAE44_0021203 [Dichanthelium oligosanthes]